MRVAAGVLWLLGWPLAAQNPPAQAGAAGAQATPTVEPTFRVVVHADNPTVEMEAAKVSRIFRKKIKRWDHDVRILPIDLDLRSPVRNDFTRAVHGKSVTAIHSFWQRMIFGKGEVPPEEKSSEQEALDYIRANPGAIGYVGAGTALGDDVKELKITP